MCTDQPPQIQLMVQIRLTTQHVWNWNPVNHEINYQPQLASQISSSPTIQNFFQVDAKILYSSCEQLPNPLLWGEEIQRRIADGILGMLVVPHHYQGTFQISGGCRLQG